MSELAPITAVDAARNKEVLVVEDDPTVMELLALILEGRGYTVHTACDGQQALTRLETLSPHMILLDVTMPKIDGIRVLHRIRRDARLQRTPVIMLSGMSEAEDVTLAMDAGADMYLTKPFSPSEVCLVLDRFAATAPEAPIPAPKPKSRWSLWPAAA